MRYNISNRVQKESYCCEVSFIQDVLSTLFNPDLDTDCVDIISDKYMTECILKAICKVEINGFEFDLQMIEFGLDEDGIDEYRITISDDGSIYIEPAIDKNAEYYMCDGFMFVEREVSSDVYLGDNRRNNVMVFSIEDC